MNMTDENRCEVNFEPSMATNRPESLVLAWHNDAFPFSVFRQSIFNVGDDVRVELNNTIVDLSVRINAQRQGRQGRNYQGMIMIRRGSLRRSSHGAFLPMVDAALTDDEKKKQERERSILVEEFADDNDTDLPELVPVN